MDSYFVLESRSMIHYVAYASLGAAAANIWRNQKGEERSSGPQLDIKKDTGHFWLEKISPGQGVKGYLKVLRIVFLEKASCQARQIFQTLPCGESMSGEGAVVVFLLEQRACSVYGWRLSSGDCAAVALADCSRICGDWLSSVLLVIVAHMHF